MTHPPLLARIPAPVERGDLLYASSSAMQDIVGFGRPWTIKALAVTTDIPVSTLKSYWSGENAPRLDNFLSIAQVLGPAFVNRILEVIDLGGAGPLSAPAGPLDLNRVASEFVALVGEHLTDDKTPNRIDAGEFRTEVPVIRRLHSTAGGVLLAAKRIA